MNSPPHRENRLNPYKVFQGGWHLKPGADMTASMLRADLDTLIDQRGAFFEKQSGKLKAEVEALPVVRVAAGQARIIGSALGGDIEAAARQYGETYADAMEDAILVVGGQATSARAIPTRVQSATLGEGRLGEVSSTRSVPAGSSLQRRPFNRKEVTRGFQDHHIISDKNQLTKQHELLDEAGFDLQSRPNKMLLPSSDKLHPTRSIHVGRHKMQVSERLAGQMDQILEIGRAESWTPARFQGALRQLLQEERKALRSGERALNKIKRSGAQ